MSQPEPLFGRSKPVIAMVHVGALPGTPAGVFTAGSGVNLALREA